MEKLIFRDGNTDGYCLKWYYLPLARLNLSERDILMHQKSNLKLNDPATTEFRKKLLQKKSFLRNLYKEWYKEIASSLPEGKELVLELGSGAGFLKNYIPGLITSDIIKTSNIKIVLDAKFLPFKNETLKSIVMIDVFHHLPECRMFLKEASRCVRRGGSVIMIEPWVSSWSSLIYKIIKHEPFMAEKEEWEFISTGPLSGANSALPWIVFNRDKSKFESEFRQWSVRSISPLMPFSYLLSGGFSFLSLLPGWTYFLCRRIEKMFDCFKNNLAMFTKIELIKN